MRFRNHEMLSAGPIEKSQGSSFEALQIEDDRVGGIRFEALADA
jgi:hypothetical protein